MKKLLKTSETIAIIGCSSKPARTSHRIAKYLMDAGFTIIPVNPNEVTVLGEKAYPDMSEIPADIEVDIVDIFRNKQYTQEMVEQIVKWSDETGQKPVIWTQIGVSSKGAKKLAEINGFTYIHNRCIMVEHSKLD